MKRSVNEYDENRGGGVGTSLLKEAAGATGIAAGLYGVGKADRNMTKLGDERREKEQREAASEMKRESRGVPKPANFDVIEEAKRDAQDAKDRKKISDMGYAKGGSVRSSASKRADGIAIRGRTRA
jgi:hypothetical protein